MLVDTKLSSGPGRHRRALKRVEVEFGRRRGKDLQGNSEPRLCGEGKEQSGRACAAAGSYKIKKTTSPGATRGSGIIFTVPSRRAFSAL